MQFYTADLCDEHRDRVQVLTLPMNNYGKATSCSGRIVTLKLDEQNDGLIKLLKSDGQGQIAVVDVDAKFYAVVGENLMKFAKENNWVGIVINGYVRDIEATSQIDVGLFALGTCPRKSFAEPVSQQDIPLEFGGVKFNPGDYLYADQDGIIVSESALV